MIRAMSSLKKAEIAAEMRKLFGDDEKRITHALDVLSFAEKILLGEPGDSDVVIGVALLHDIGIHEAERKHGSSAARYQEIEGPPIARRILEKLEEDPDLISEVCDIVSHHHSPRKDETLNFRILYDADLIVNLRDEVAPSRLAGMGEKFGRMFLTPTGLDVARETFLK